MSVYFTKENPDGVGIWLGTVSGAVDGGLQTILLNADQSEPVWRTRDRRGGVIRPVGSTQ